MFFKDKAREQRDKIILYKKVFNSPEGREILFDLMNKFHLLNSHKGDPFAEGQRSVVLAILQQTRINLKEFDELLKEE